MRAIAWLIVAVACVGCDEARVNEVRREEEVVAQTVPTDEDRAAEIDVPSLFPVRVGDRWRQHIGDIVRTYGVTARTGNGLAVVFGHRDERPAYYRVSRDEVALVSPDGNVIEPLLRGPIERGAEWSYGMGDGALRARCRARVSATGAAEPRFGRSDCVEVSRECEHPVGGPFRVPTARRTDEVYCPRIGRVRSRTQLIPAVDTMSDPATAEIVNYIVAGAERPRREEFGCDEMLLLPSDVQAACGSAWHWEQERASERGCAHTFRDAADATLEVRMSHQPDLETARARAQERANGSSALRAEGEYLLEVDAPDCPEERVGALLALLRSLIE